MSKPQKKSEKKDKKNKARKTESSGQLIALEGARGPAVLEESERLARLYCANGDPAWSRWDASNTFYELSLSKAGSLNPTAATLLLLYASDLLFRLRWEIEPALKEGRNVVAGPYVESAIGFGVAAGLSKEWLQELFSFAPKPDAWFRLKEKHKAKSRDKKGARKKAGKTTDGFVEFCCAGLRKNYPGFGTAEVRKGILKHLDGLEEQGSLRRLGKKPPKLLAG